MMLVLGCLKELPFLNPSNSVFFGQYSFMESFLGTRMSMVLSKWIITPIKVGCKSRK